MRVTTVRARTLRIPLQTPVLVGTGWEIAARDYLLVALATDAGLIGIGWTYTRGADLVSEVDRLAPNLVGADPARTERLWSLMARAVPAGSQTSAPARALSALDVALWDLKAQAAGLPLHKLLGGHRAEVPVQMAAMYYTRGRRPDDDARDAAALVEGGFHTLKMMGGVAPFGDDLARVRAVRAAIGPAVILGLDVHHAWHDAKQATEHAKALKDYDVAFVEEPIPPERAGDLPALNRDSPIPIAMGELAFGLRAYEELVEGGIGVLRPDATVGGGITEWIRAHGLATAQGVHIVPHYFPYVHIHVAAGLAGVDSVECVSTAGDISNFHRIVRERLEPRGGVLRAPLTPGLGINLDWDAVDRYTVPDHGN
jgi:D-arabinonate dehydratase